MEYESSYLMKVILTIILKYVTNISVYMTLWGILVKNVDRKYTRKCLNIFMFLTIFTEIVML